MKIVLRLLLNHLGYRIVPRDRDAQTLSRYLSRLPIRTVIDVGANNGSTCRHWLETYPTAKVHGIEVLDQFTPDLDRIAASSGARMTRWQFAASDSNGKTEFFTHVDHPSSSSLLETTEDCENALPFTKAQRRDVVVTRALDSVFIGGDVAIEDDILIKLDVQGAEEKVFAGAPQLLKRTCAVICEVNLLPQYKGQGTWISTFQTMDYYGLSLTGFLEQFHDEKDRPVYCDAVFVRKDRV